MCNEQLNNSILNEDEKNWNEKKPEESSFNMY